MPGEKKDEKRQVKDFIELKPLFFVEVYKIYEAKNNNDKDEEEELIEAHITSDFLLAQDFSRTFLEHFPKQRKFPYKLIKFTIKSFRLRLAETLLSSVFVFH